MKKVILIAFLLSGLYLANSSAQTIFTNFDDFEAACEAAQPGDEIILAAGRYTPSGIKMVDVAGTAGNPIIIRAEQIGADTLDADTYFELIHCSFVTIQGFVINITGKSTTFKIQACNNIRITQNILDGSGEDNNSSTWVSIQGYWDDATGRSHHNLIDHNLFRNKHTPGNMIRIDGTDETWVSQYDVIEYNHFKNMGPRVVNEMEVIRIGWSEMSESDGYCLVSNNLFEECNGDPEIISVKCNKNTLAHNTFLRCQGTLSLRHGNESLVEGNFFLGEETEGTGGVRIYGSDHRIINNYFEGLTGTKWDAPITLTYGDEEEGGGSLSDHFRIERALIANNTLVNNHHGIEVGYDNQGKYGLPPRNVVLAYNVITSDTGSFATYINLPDNMRWVDNLFFASGDANISEGVIFNPEEVIEIDPQLVWVDSLSQYKATTGTPTYTNSESQAGTIEYDIDGHLRSVPTQYGADEYQAGAVVYYPLTNNDVGPEMGDYLQTNTATFGFSVSSDTADVAIYSSLDWEVRVNETWIFADPVSGSGDGTVRIIVEENLNRAPRNGSILVSDNGSLHTGITVNQEGSVGTEVKLRIVAAVASTEQTSEGNIAENVYDGELDNRWSGEGDGATIDLKLENESVVSFVKVGPYKGAERYTYFDIQTSLDGVTYFDALLDNAAGMTAEPMVIFDIPDTSSNFIRIVGHGNSFSAWNSFTEFEAWGWEKESNGEGTAEFMNSALKIYPNPSDGSFFLQSIPGSQVEIRDLSGRMLWRYEVKETVERMDTGLSAGIYYMQIKFEKKTIGRKIIFN